MVKNGFSRAYGENLRQVISAGTKNRLTAFASGAIVTALLQSSTASTLITLSFVKKGFMTVTAALAVIIGADVATTFVAQVLTFDLHWLSPVLISSGVVVFSFYEHGGRTRHIARVMIGLGLMLLSLSLIREISQPLKTSDVLPLILRPLESETGLAIVFGALFTWAVHSSLATILLFATLVGHGVISMHLGFTLVLGANLGSAFIPFLATIGDGPRVRRITVGNLVMKATIIFILAPFIPLVMEFLIAYAPGAEDRQLVNFHTVFNLILGVIFLPLAKIFAHLLIKIFPERQNGKDGNAPAYLDSTALDTPVIALAGAARETLRMAEIVERMLEKTITAFEKNDDNLIASIRAMDDRVDRLNQEIKFYLTKLSQESFEPNEANRYIQILTFSTNLENCGDVIDKSLMDIAMKKIRKQEKFSEKGFAEIRGFHETVLQNLRLAQNIFLSGDAQLARRLVENKRTIRQAEMDSSRSHFGRLREGLSQSVATSDLHLDIIRDLRRINSYITSVAYTIIDNHEQGKKTPAPEKPREPAEEQPQVPEPPETPA
jgi:phosphate:Na+ symporter